MKKLFLILIVSAVSIYSQELNCKVTVNFEGLPVNNRELLKDFASAIEGYMNTTQFTGQRWEGDKIDCSLNIFFTGASGDIDYSAQTVVVSTRPIYQSPRQSPMLTINDPVWSFRFEKNQALYSNQATFDPITSYLDFYANIIIGFDTDSFEELGGTDYFKKAFDIVNLANSSGYSKGWERNNASYGRWKLCEDLLVDKFRIFRESVFEYHYGVDEYQIRKIEGQKKIVNLVNLLDELRNKMDINSVLIRTFFDSKYGEIIELLKSYPDEQVFAKLKRIDPAHSARYDEVLK